MFQEYSAKRLMQRVYELIADYLSNSEENDYILRVNNVELNHPQQENITSNTSLVSYWLLDLEVNNM